MRVRSKVWVLGAATVLSLGACDGGGSAAGATADGAEADGAAGGEAPARAKLDAYTVGLNKLIDTFGLSETAGSYRDEAIASKSPSDDISISTGWLEQALEQLKAARALPGGPADLDAAGERLIATLGTALTHLQSLDVYYESKAYRDDGLKRGRAEDAAMRAELAAAEDAMSAFNTVLARERRAVTDAELAALKSGGDDLAYDTKLALRQADDLVSLFDKPADIRDPAVIAKADAQVGQLEATLTALRAAVAKGKAAATPDAPLDVNYGLVADGLTRVLGDYRDLKQSRSGEDYDDMVESYNDAVGDANDISG